MKSRASIPAVAAILSVFLCAQGASAGERHDHDPPPTPTKARAESTATADAESTATASASANNAGVNVDASSPKQAPAVMPPSVYPTAACQGGLSLGGSGAGGGGAIGFSFSKAECETVVYAQNLANIGLLEAACEALKTTKAAARAQAKGAKAPDCSAARAPESRPSQGPGPGVVVVQQDLANYPTKSEVAETVRRAFEQAAQK